jgi:tetratricopeptide (TPR) repeat protein
MASTARSGGSSRQGDWTTSSRRRARRMAHGAANLLLLTATVALCIGFMEAGYRAFGYLSPLDHRAKLTVQTFHKQPHAGGKWLIFDREHDFLFESNVRYNNQGFRSDIDWSDRKEAGEFRIAVFGDSYTECITNDFPWTDATHRRLTADAALLSALDRQKITVGNFGISGGGFHDFATTYLRVRDRFKPDLVVFAFIDEDFERLSPANLAIVKEAVRTGTSLAAPAAAPPASDPYYQYPIPGFDHLYASWDGSKFSAAVQYDGSDTAGLFDKARMMQVRRHLANVTLWRRYVANPRCFVCEMAVAAARRLGIGVAQASWPRAARTSEFLAAFRDSVDTVAEKPVLAIALPAFYEMVDMFNAAGPPRPARYWPLAAQAFPDIPFVALTDFLPAETPYDERYSWFILPHDGHPSNKGAQLYGEAVAEVLAKYLSPGGRATMPEGVVVAPAARDHGIEHYRAYNLAFDQLDEARRLTRARQYPAALAAYDEVMRFSPHLGAPGVLWSERAAVHESLGDMQRAFEDYSQSVASSPNPNSLVRRIAAARAVGRWDAMREDVARLAAIDPGNAALAGAREALRAHGSGP